MIQINYFKECFNLCKEYQILRYRKKRSHILLNPSKKPHNLPDKQAIERETSKFIERFIRGISRLPEVKLPAALLSC